MLMNMTKMKISDEDEDVTGDSFSSCKLVSKCPLTTWLSGLLRLARLTLLIITIIRFCNDDNNDHYNLWTREFCCWFDTDECFVWGIAGHLINSDSCVKVFRILVLNQIRLNVSVFIHEFFISLFQQLYLYLDINLYFPLTAVIRVLGQNAREKNLSSNFCLLQMSASNYICYMAAAYDDDHDIDDQDKDRGRNLVYYRQ